MKFDTSPSSVLRTRLIWYPSYVQEANVIEQFCSSNGKYRTFIEQELLKITIESQVIFPCEFTMTLELIDEKYVDTSALQNDKISLVW
jgi:hypothetical protein